MKFSTSQIKDLNIEDQTLIDINVVPVSGAPSKINFVFYDKEDQTISVISNTELEHYYANCGIVEYKGFEKPKDTTKKHYVYREDIPVKFRADNPRKIDYWDSNYTITEVPFIDFESSSTIANRHNLHSKPQPLSNGSTITFLHKSNYHIIPKFKYISGEFEMWYKGVQFRYKALLGGWNVENSIPWVYKKKTYMTSETYCRAINEFNEVYPIVAFSETRVPYCAELDLSTLNFEKMNISKINWCFSKSSYLKRVNMGRLDLSKVDNAYRLFEQDTKIELIDMSNCVGDLDLSIKEKFGFSEGKLEKVWGKPPQLSSLTIVVLPLQAKNLLQMMVEKQNRDCTNHLYVGDIRSINEYKSLYTRIAIASGGVKPNANVVTRIRQ